jgi:hypothetical protein
VCVPVFGTQRDAFCTCRVGSHLHLRDPISYALWLAPLTFSYTVAPQGGHVLPGTSYLVSGLMCCDRLCRSWVGLDFVAQDDADQPLTSHQQLPSRQPLIHLVHYNGTVALSGSVVTISADVIASVVSAAVRTRAVSVSSGWAETKTWPAVRAAQYASLAVASARRTTRSDDGPLSSRSSSNPTQVPISVVVFLFATMIPVAGHRRPMGAYHGRFKIVYAARMDDL